MSEKYKFKGYRIDGVAACRLAWQFFNAKPADVLFRDPPTKEDFLNDKVSEPLAVRLAGLYDIWDKRDPRAELFQHGLRTRDLQAKEWGDRSYWEVMLSQTDDAKALVNDLLVSGKYLEYARGNEYREVITSQGFDVEFEGLKFLACNSHECDIRSQLFAAGIRPEHQALLGFTFTGKAWRVSLYHAPGHEDIDLSVIAVKHGGGGHRGACGFTAASLPFIP